MSSERTERIGLVGPAFWSMVRRCARQMQQGRSKSALEKQNGYPRKVTDAAEEMLKQSKQKKAG